MGNCLFLPTEAADITIFFITPFGQMGFAEAHGSQFSGSLGMPRKATSH